ncbi:hypothetical protein DUI87_02212 [Hirundo rustica rustica]|uniref:Peptidase A2 domain-containing protein n=1 Tax=Hirundo rustica rustica TaxID=333673 RepID=A0A3M0LEE7_HIRRU|nr:hypothetical protein DUI87_02212 [Hirundo rustica rustica]
MATGGLCCRPPSPDSVPLPDELEESPNEGAVLPPAKPPAEPTIGLKELTEQIQMVTQCLDERAHATTELLLNRAQELSTINAKNQEEPTSFSSQLTPMQRLLQQTAESSPLAMPSPAPPVARWSRIIRDAILEGQWEPAGHIAYPVACPVVFRDGNPVYEQHEWKILQQAKNTVKEHGLKSETARAMLDWIHTADLNSPLDCANIAQLLLSPSQYLVWQWEWVRLAKVEVNCPREQNDILFGLTADMVTGDGRFANVNLQLQYPLPLFQLVASTARQAYYAVPDSSLSPSFTAVQQGLTENFTHFIDQLSQALTNHPGMDEASKQGMFKMLAFENANPKTKSILATLPQGAEVADMIKLSLRAEQASRPPTVLSETESRRRAPVTLVFLRPRAVGSSSTAWTLPPCQVTICPKDRGQFWGEAKAKVEGLSDGADAVAGPAVSGTQSVPSRVPASDPVGSTGQDKAGAAASSEGLQAFPVLQGATHKHLSTLGLAGLTELRDAVGKYGLGSAEVVQVLRYFNASLLTPFDIRSLARALFPPVEYDFFEHKWPQLAVIAVERNTTLGPGDPRRMVNTDMLMGTGNYTRADRQAGFEPLVQEQCQQTGMAALVQAIQLATPQQSFATIVQGADEPFLSFAGRLTAAVEKQVSDPAARTEDRLRGDGGFGSTGPPQVHWTAVLTKDRPETLCTVSMVGATPSEIHLRGLLDSRADVSILSLAAWPPQWPLSLAKTSIAGL